MSLPVVAVAKAAAAVLENPKTRKALGAVLAGVMSPVILIVAVLCGVLSGAAQHNRDTAALVFSDAPLPAALPADYRAHIGKMRAAFAGIDGAVAALEAEAEGGGPDVIRIKAMFYALYFGGDPSAPDPAAFTSAFVRWEERTRIVTVSDETGTRETEETYEVPIPVSDMGEVCAALSSRMGIAVSREAKADGAEIYYLISGGAYAPTYGREFDDWLAGLPLSDEPFVGADGFCSPLGGDWRRTVTSEFGERRDPFTGALRGHTGLDMGAPLGTPVRAALSGTVRLVRYSAGGYGYHLMIDHGGGTATLYAHCSDITVNEGEYVNAGDIIAEVGSTGRSTGNHLHFEVIAGGTKQNPRNYLP
jgi:murein DD-endopeptidase MepM/ murein hydrolase activator NlpD